MPKTCYYEVLGVSSEADAETLKKAYRKCALRWHPDKNIGDETAHENFLAVQEAYATLSDPHERAWYDKHKDQILGDDDKDFEYFNIYSYFRASCFDKKDVDGERGFFTVYRTVFDKITEEDEAAVGKGKHEAPAFGASDSDYSEIVEPFYNFWSQYSTKLTFSWTDEKISREYGRNALRYIKKENQKRREKLRKERNEEVRNLVRFVRMRDPRVAAWKARMEEEKNEKLQKAEEIRREKILENKRANETYQESDWSKFSTLEHELLGVEESLNEKFPGASSEEDENDEEDEKIKGFFCAACRKLFMSEKAFQNHEGSKKHKLNVAAMENS